MRNVSRILSLLIGLALLVTACSLPQMPPKAGTSPRSKPN